MKQFRAGVVGIGFIGAVHVEQLRRLGNVTVAAAVSSSREKAESLCIPHWYGNYKDMIDNENLDCIHICTPNDTHYEIAMYAMDRGVHVVCEKPLAVSLEEGEAMKKKAAEKGLVNAVNFNCRFYPLVYQMREMIRAGTAGSVYTVHGGYLQDWLYFDTDYNWRLEPELSGNSRAFADIGSHWLDMVHFTTGLQVTEVLADFEIFHKKRKKPAGPIDTFSGMSLRPEDYQETAITTEDYASVIFHFDNGAHGCCTISQVFAGRKNQMLLSIGGSKCALHWDSENSNALWTGYRDRENGEMVKDPSILLPAAGKVNGCPGGHVEGFPDTFKQNFRKIYGAVAGTPSDDYAVFDDGLREMRICEKIMESAKERRWVSV